MGDHTECFQLDYDPKSISYEDLLEQFWMSHDATSRPFKVQYASLILAGNEQQLEAAKESAQNFSAVMGRPVTTRIGMLDHFWLAEEYHQKYYLRNDRLLFNELHSIYPAEKAFVDSTAAARVNGFLYGTPSCMLLDKELPRLGLSSEGQEHLKKHCRG